MDRYGCPRRFRETKIYIRRVYSEECFDIFSIIYKKIYTLLSIFVISSELFFDLEFFNGLLLKLLLKINTMNVIFQYLLCDVNDASESARNTYREERKKLFN